MCGYVSLHCVCTHRLRKLGNAHCPDSIFPTDFLTVSLSAHLLTEGSWEVTRVGVGSRADIDGVAKLAAPTVRWECLCPPNAQVVMLGGWGLRDQCLISLPRVRLAF